jgi:hypothetical protein
LSSASSISMRYLKTACILWATANGPMGRNEESAPPSISIGAIGVY